MRLTFITAALGALALAGAAQAQDRGAALAALDANGDGSITRAEAEAGRAVLFAEIDADGDGQISAEERGRAQQQRREGRMMARADKNGDGRLSRAEFMDMPYLAFQFGDRNGDNVLDAAELAALRDRAAQRR